MPSIHFDIPPLKAMVREEFLHDLKEGLGMYRDAEIISISSYPGHAPTFTTLIEKKYLFHYLPIIAFSTRPNVNKINILDAVPFNCPSGELTVLKYPVLEDCQVFDKSKNIMGYGKYLMTFDWYMDNELCHLVELMGSNLVLVPSHKLVCGSGDQGGLPNFGKLHATWKV